MSVSKRVEVVSNSITHREFSSSEEMFSVMNEKQYENKVVTVCDSSLYDLTDFVSSHPGGTSLVIQFDKKDMTQSFQEEHNQSSNAKRILAQYKIGHVSGVNKDSSQDGQAYPVRKGKILHFNDFQIDLSKGYFFQIWKITKDQYLEVINNPVTVPFYVPILDTKFLDIFSVTPWYVVPLIWVPVALYHIYLGLTFQYSNDSLIDEHLKLGNQFSYLAFLLSIIFAIFTWSFAEYSLHRFLFHMEMWMPDFSICRYLAFAIHGVHHALPMDSGRLVFPPPLAAIIYYGLICLMRAVAPGNFGTIFIGGFIIGYIYYDLTHYFLHHADPKYNHHKQLKSAHNKHHYVDDTKGFGISNKFWDGLFNTGFN